MPENTANRSRRITLPFKSVDDKPYIFASYGHNDKEIVFPMLKVLYEAGYNVWYDEGIEISSDYDDVIDYHISGSTVVVYFISRLSVESPNIGEIELPLAKECGVRILPLFIEEGGGDSH